MKCPRSRLAASPRWTILLVLLVTSAASGDFEAAAEIYRSRDYVAAFNEFLTLAEDGDARAQTVIGMMYKYGESVELDLAEAFKWYEKAASQGYAPAQFSVGEMYADGQGIAANPEAAVKWLKMAASQGFERAEGRLAALGVAAGETKERPDVPWSQAWNLKLPEAVKYGEVPAQTVSPGRYRVQLGAMRTLASAERLWDLLTRPNGDLFGTLEPLILHERVYVVQTGPFPSLRAAKDFCAALVARGVKTGCLPVKSDS